MTEVVGIDVSKAKLDCLWLRDPQTRKVKTKKIANNRQGYEQLAAWLTKTTDTAPEDILVVMEATGVYHETLASTLYDKGFGVSVVNPAKIKAHGQSLGNTHKTDKQDSLIIASYGYTNRPTLWQPEPKEIRELKALIGRLRALDADIQREANRLEKTEFNGASKLVQESIDFVLNGLRKERQRLEKQVDDHIDRHPQLKQDKELLQSIPGVGSVLTRVMLAVIHSRQFRNAKQVAAYLGVIPVLVESGVFKGRSALSKKGSGYVRSKLYMAAVAASKWNPDIRRAKQRLLCQGKNKMQALGAAMRKLVHLCFGVLKNQTKYSPQAC